MQFRHPIGVRLASTSGHTAIVGPEFRDLPPVLHADAMAAGCECSDTKIDPKASVQSSAEAKARPTNHDDVIREALELMLKRGEDGDFNRDNLPNTNVVSKLAGMSIRKEDALRVFRAMQAEAAADEKAE